MSQPREIRDQLVGVLTKIPSEFNFHDAIGNSRFDRKAFDKLIDALKAWFVDKVEVEIFSQSWFVDKFGGEGGAYYSPGNNVFGFLDGYNFGDAYRKSVAVHESIHALQDGLQLSYTPPEHELTAYSGQALYYRLITKGKTRDAGIAGLMQKKTLEWDIFAAADKVAKGIANTGSLNRKSEGLDELRAAINKHPLYKPKAKGKNGKKPAKKKGDGW